MNKITIMASVKDGEDIITTPFHVYANDSMDTKAIRNGNHAETW